MTPDATASPLLEAEGVVAGYLPGVDILRGCDLSVGPGELVGVIGPNGAGKSTLVKALVGLVEVRAGTVRLRGDDITGHKAHELVERGVGYVPQVNNVFAMLSVIDNLRMGGMSHQTGSTSGSRSSPACSPCSPSVDTSA